MVRGDSAFGTKKVITTCVEQGVEFSLAVARNTRINAAIEAIDETAWTPVHYPGAVEDPDTGALISDAEVAETSYTLPLGRGRTLTVRLVVRQVKDARRPDGLFPVWHHHPFMTNSELPHHRGRHHPPPPRHHRNHLRRPDRRAADWHPVRAVRRELRLAGCRGDHPQPAARRRNPGRR